MKILLLNTWAEWPSNRVYLDHEEHEIWHAVDERGKTYIKHYLSESEVAGISFVEKDDVALFVQQMADVYARFPFERVVAFDEFTLLPGAFVRQEFGIPGPTLSDIEPYRNKRVMKGQVAAAGVRTIRDFDPVAFAASPFEPCVVKKIDGAASDGIYICRTKAEYERHRLDLEQGALLEEYVEGDIFHVDGAFNSTGLSAAPHAFMNNCYQHYKLRLPHGSVGVDEPELRNRLIDFAKSVLDALPLREGIFHLEIIRNTNDELVFLEIACRIGGGEVYSNFVDTYNFDLFGFSIALQLGLQPRLRPLRQDNVAGWLMINDFPNRPGLFNAFRCATVAPDNCMYTMKNGKLGRGVTDHDYVSFVFRGKTSKEVRSSISELMAKVTLETSPPAERDG